MAKDVDGTVVAHNLEIAMIRRKPTIVQLKNLYPQSIWACGVDGANLMTFGTPQQVADEVLRQINQTNALPQGGLFIGSSSEINPPGRSRERSRIPRQPRHRSSHN